MKHVNKNAGFSLVEIMVSIIVFGLFSTQIALTIAHASLINARTDAMLKSQMEVSEVAEKLMAEGIKSTCSDADYKGTGVKVTANKDDPSDSYFTVTIKCTKYVSPTMLAAEDGTHGSVPVEVELKNIIIHENTVNGYDGS